MVDRGAKTSTKDRRTEKVRARGSEVGEDQRGMVQTFQPNGQQQSDYRRELNREISAVERGNEHVFGDSSRNTCSIRVQYTRMERNVKGQTNGNEPQLAGARPSRSTLLAGSMSDEGQIEF